MQITSINNYSNYYSQKNTNFQAKTNVLTTATDKVLKKGLIFTLAALPLFTSCVQKPANNPKVPTIVDVFNSNNTYQIKNTSEHSIRRAEKIGIERLTLLTLVEHNCHGNVLPFENTEWNGATMLCDLDNHYGRFLQVGNNRDLYFNKHTNSYYKIVTDKNSKDFQILQYSKNDDSLNVLEYNNQGCLKKTNKFNSNTIEARSFIDELTSSNEYKIFDADTRNNKVNIPKMAQ